MCEKLLIIYFENKIWACAISIHFFKILYREEKNYFCDGRLLS